MVGNRMTENRDKFVFYSQSLHDKPGLGKGEFVMDHTLYTELDNILHWRRILSNFHVCPFVYKNMTFNSIEHAFQAAKIAIADVERAKLFAIESKSKLARGNGFDARKARKMVLLSKEQQRWWNNTSADVLAEIAKAKYQQCALARLVLKETKDAELWHVQYRLPMVRFKHLEHIRTSLQ